MGVSPYVGFDHFPGQGPYLDRARVKALQAGWQAHPHGCDVLVTDRGAA